MDPTGIVAASAVISGILYVLVRIERARARRMDRVWEDAARAVRGKFVLGEAGATRMLSVTSDGADLQADEYQVGKYRYSRICVGVPNSMGLELSVKRYGVFETIGKALDALDSTGDAPFDDEFATEASNRDIGRLWLHAPVRTAIRASGDWTFSLSRGTLTLIRPSASMPEDSAALARAVRSALVVARRGAELEREWAALASELDGIVVKPFDVSRAELGAITIARGGAEARVSVRRAEQGVQTSVSAEANTAIDDASWEPLRQRAQAAGAQTMRLESGRVTVEARGILLDAPALRELLSVLAVAIAVPTLGPYR